MQHRKTTMQCIPTRSVLWLMWMLLSQSTTTSFAQTAVNATLSPSTSAPKSIAILAAAGDQFQYVRRKPAVASRIEPFVRQWVTMPNNGLNLVVLRGMDRALAAQYPDAE
ncbi:MAG: hypothetical protein ABIZ83_03505, partial [Casimicrobium sp.]